MHKHIIKIAIILLSVVFLVCCLLLLFTYVIPTQSPFIKKTTSFLPAVFVDEKVITVGEISENTEATRNFYENREYEKGGLRIDFTTPDGQKRLKIVEREVINKLVENAVVEDVAAKLGITVSSDDVAEALKKTLEGADLETAKANAALYGWTLDEFARKVIKPSLFVKAVEENFNAQNSAPPEMFTVMEEAQKMIADGRSFADAARKYSRGMAAQEGGAQGIFTRSQLDPVLADAAFALEVGVVSEIIETSIGLHLIMIDDIITDVSGEDAVSLNHIYLPKEFFSAYLHDEVAKRNIAVFLPGYAWSEQDNYVVSSNAEMRAFEQKIVEEAYQQTLEQAQEELDETDDTTSQDQQSNAVDAGSDEVIDNIQADSESQ